MYDVSLKQKEELVNKMLLARQRVSVVTSHGVYTNLYKSSTAITVTIIVGERYLHTAMQSIHISFL